MALISKATDKVNAGQIPPKVNPNAMASRALAVSRANNPGLGYSAAGGGQGKDFTIARQGQAAGVLEGALTDVEEGDYQNRESLRGLLAQEIGSFQGNNDARKESFMADQERGLSRALQQARRQAGGAGLGGSLQQGRGMGDILAASRREQNKGLLDLQGQRSAEIGRLAQTQGSVLQQSLLERGFTLEQAKTFADLLQRQAELEQGSILGTQKAQGPSDFERGLGYALQGAAVAATASDIDLKENITLGGKEIETFLSQMTPYRYNYTDEKHGAGTYVSVMAQDLEKTELGRDLVINTKDGKMVDYGKALGLMLAANIHLNSELQKIKERLDA
jgi:hypothetical protein